VSTSVLEVPAGRRGPGPMPPAVLETLDLALARRAAGLLPGDRPAPGVGAGTELAQLRPYQPGDDVRQLDPAATARTSIPHVRLQVPERVLTTWLILDLSASMAFGTADRLKADVAEGVALAVGRLALRRGGRLAVVTAGTARDRVLPPTGGTRALVTLRRLLGEGIAPDGAGPGRGLAPAVDRVGRVARQRGLVVIVSDFGGARDWRRPLGALATRHGVLAVEVRDPREEALPAAGHLSLVDPETGQLVEVDTSRRRLRERFAAAAREDREAVAADLRRARAEHILLSTRGDWLRELGRRLR